MTTVGFLSCMSWLGLYSSWSIRTTYRQGWRVGTLVNPALRAKIQREQVRSLNQKNLATLNLNEILLGLS